MKKNLLIVAIAITALAGCTEETFVGDQSLREANGSGAISFGFDVPAVTRASGSGAAEKLGNQFIVYGEKSETQSGEGAGNTPAAGHLVFPNYLVNWVDNSAYTTTSNTKDWEYVGFKYNATGQIKSGETQYNYTGKISMAGTSVSNDATVAQTIKYWDYSASNYVFTAVSANAADIEAGNVTIQKNTSGSDVYHKGYTLTLNASADPTKIYLADRELISPSTSTDRDAVNAYGGNVTLTFRSLVSQIRVGMYETISGYNVIIKNFYYLDGANPTFGTMETAGTDKFYANVPNLTTASGATLTVNYYSSGDLQNQPTVSVDGTANKYLALGDGNLKGDNTASSGTVGSTLGESSTGATFDQAGGKYTNVFPQETNAQNLKLKVDYTLYNSVSGEKIEVTGATAEIPAMYLKWKPNYKYTYLFKISENTNGYTGSTSGPAGLWPITFDALVVEAENGLAEYITTVSEPSITTFGAIWDGSKYTGYQTGKNEYQEQTGSNRLDIYATIMEGSTLVTPVLSGSGHNVNIYHVRTSDAAFPVTEASLAEAIAESGGSAGEKIIYTDITDGNSTYIASAPSAVTTVPGEDGVNITETHAVQLSGLKIINSADTYYAIEYVTGKWFNDGGKTYTSAPEGQLYSNPDCTTGTETTWANNSTTYYKRTKVKNVYKIIKITPAS